MTVYTPTSWHVWNEVDQIGLLLGLPRLQLETNAQYKQRLMDVFVHRADSSRLGLMYGITRELGLSLFKAMTITPVWNGTGTAYLAENPAIVFEDTKCYLYDDWTDGDDGLAATLDRYDTGDGSFTIAQLASSIAATGYFAVSVNPLIDANQKAMTIYNQSSVGSTISESIATGGPVIDLLGNKLYSNSVVISSPNLRERVLLQSDLKKLGQYFIDYEYGIIYTTEAPSPGSSIRYQYRIDEFEVWASPVILHNLRSDDFKTKLFEQVEMDDGEFTNGLPTALGSDIIAELMSVQGVTYAK